VNVLLVEDHARLADLMKRGLEAANFAVDVFGCGDDALAALECAHYDAIVLDLGLPDLDGFDVLETLRARGHEAPVLITTSRIRVPDRVKGLNLGADDYLTKPFAMEELVARLHALLRRPGSTLGATLNGGNLAFDTVAREIRVGDKAVNLSPREKSVLEHLLRRKGRVVPKGVLEDAIYGLGGTATANSVEVMVHRLRKRLDSAGADVIVHTVRGVGYMLAEPDGA